MQGYESEADIFFALKGKTYHSLLKAMLQTNRFSMLKNRNLLAYKSIE